jgi:hypothetical protein
LTHLAFPTLYEDHGVRGAGRAFVDGIRERSIKQHLLLGDKKTLIKALRQTLKLEVIKLAVRLRKMSDRTM